MSDKAEPTARITKNSRSPIWRYFEPISKTNTKCLLCQSTYRNSGNTTNLIDHLKRRHKETYAEFTEVMKSGNTSTTLHPVIIAEIGDTVSADSTKEIPAAVEIIKYETESEVNPKEEEDEATEESVAINSSEVIEQEILEEDTVHEEGQLLAQIENGKIYLETDDGQHDFVQECKIVPLPHARSEVWSYFGFIADQEGQILDRSKVVCKLCNSQFCYSGNTTNFYSHLKSMHSEVQMRSVPSKNSRSVKRTYSSMNDDAADTDYLNDATSTVVYSNVSQEVSLVDDESIPSRSRSDLIHVDDITNSIVDFIVTDCRPLAITQGRGFQGMLRLLAPGYALPDKAKLALAVRRKYDQMRKDREQGALDGLTAIDY